MMLFPKPKKPTTDDVKKMLKRDVNGEAAPEASGAQELHLKYRPKTFKEVLGQAEAVRTLETFLRDGRVPHALLLHGPTGVGKTTIARILARKLGCHPHDLSEENCAAWEEPKKAVDKIHSKLMLSPGGRGKCRVFILDEVQSLSRAGFTQQALLKTLEDTPKHVYFMLCTTDPGKLLPAVRGRCTEVVVRPLAKALIESLVETTAVEEGMTLGEGALERIIETAGGCPREALVLLNGLVGITDPEEQLAAVQPPQMRIDAYNIVRALLWGKGGWREVCDILSSFTDKDYEGLRKNVLANARNELLKGNIKVAPNAALVIECFQYPFFDSEWAGFAYACWKVLNGRK